MAMMAPQAGPQAGPPPGGPPGGAPPGPQGPPPGPQAPPPPMPPPPGQQPGQSPQPSVYSDLSVSMPPQWQLVDVAQRNIMAALQTGAFYKQPPVYAALKDLANTLTRLISSYSSQQKPVTADASQGSKRSPGVSDSDADSQPDTGDTDSIDLGDDLGD